MPAGEYPFRGTIVGVEEGGDYYILDQITPGDHASPGIVTGYVLSPIRSSQHRELIRPESMEAALATFWITRPQGASLREFVVESYRERGESLLWDLTGREFWQAIRLRSGLSPEEAPLFHTVSCGMVFTTRVAWGEVHEPGLLWAILGWQDGDTLPMEMLCDAHTDRDRGVPPVPHLPSPSKGHVV